MQLRSGKIIGEKRIKLTPTQYNVFIKYQMKFLKQQYPDKENTELFYIIARMWRSIRDSL